MTWPRRIEVFALSRLKLKWPNLTRNILCYRLENNKTGVSQSRNLKTTTFTESSATDVLILAALVHNLCLWSSMVCCASPYLAALCLSLWAYHFPLLLLLILPFPPISSQAQDAAGVLTRGRSPGRMRGRCLHGVTLLCPLHWLLRNRWTVGSNYIANNSKNKKINK